MNEFVVGTIVNGRAITEIGSSNTFAFPVKFNDGTYGIIASGDEHMETAEWIPDAELAVDAIRDSLQMPVVQRGIGSDVLHVRGTDHEGPYLAKLFYNDKKFGPNARDDEIYRQ